MFSVQSQTPGVVPRNSRVYSDPLDCSRRRGGRESGMKERYERYHPDLEALFRVRSGCGYERHAAERRLRRRIVHRFSGRLSESLRLHARRTEETFGAGNGRLRVGRIPGTTAARIPRFGGGAPGSRGREDVHTLPREQGEYLTRALAHRAVATRGAVRGSAERNWATWRKGVLDVPREDMASLAGRIGRRIV